MSRSGYSEDLDQWSLICWRGAVKSSIRGKRGQAFLRELAEALDAMPEKKLVYGDLITPQGDVCAIGSVLKKRCVDVTGIDVDDYETIAKLSGVAEALVREIENVNDEAWRAGEKMTDEKRFEIVRYWVARQIKEPTQ